VTDSGETDPSATDPAALAEEYKQKYLYALADAENARKRAQRQSEDSNRSYKRRLLLKFLPVLDNLQRSLSYHDSEGLRSGLAATLRGFDELLESEGVTPILTTGEHFDPSIAEAVATQPAGDAEEGTVIAESQRGYLLDSELLRPARVIVAKKSE